MPIGASGRAKAIATPPLLRKINAYGVPVCGLACVHIKGRRDACPTEKKQKKGFGLLFLPQARRPWLLLHRFLGNDGNRWPKGSRAAFLALAPSWRSSLCDRSFGSNPSGRGPLLEGPGPGGEGGTGMSPAAEGALPLMAVD